jgi:hypothetical protein
MYFNMHFKVLLSHKPKLFAIEKTNKQTMHNSFLQI